MASERDCHAAPPAAAGEEKGSSAGNGGIPPGRDCGDAAVSAGHF